MATTCSCPPSPQHAGPSPKRLRPRHGRAKLWVGDRQDDHPGHAAAARMPRRLMTGTVAEMAVDAHGWVAAEALAVDEQRRWSLDPAEPVNGQPHRATPVRVHREAGGYSVQSDLPAEHWVPTSPGHDQRALVLSATFAGSTTEAPSVTE